MKREGPWAFSTFLVLFSRFHDPRIPNQRIFSVVGIQGGGVAHGAGASDADDPGAEEKLSEFFPFIVSA